jgi:hypothetical protein
VPACRGIEFALEIDKFSGDQKVIKAMDESKNMTKSQRIALDGANYEKLKSPRSDDKEKSLTGNNNINGVNFIEQHVTIDDLSRISRLNSTTGQFSISHHEHHSSVPFSKKGNIVRGILCPSLTNSFR